jgi:hypothetical protein
VGSARREFRLDCVAAQTAVLAAVHVAAARLAVHRVHAIPAPHHEAVEAPVKFSAVAGDIRACYLNDSRSPYTGVLRSLFGSCGGGLLYRHPQPGKGGLYVCESHASTPAEVEIDEG